MSNIIRSHLGSLSKTLTMAVVLIALVGCTPLHGLNKTENARIASLPSAEATRTMTNFTQSLQCMDELLLKYHPEELIIAAQPVQEDSKHKIGIKDMFITAVSSMSTRSQSIKISLHGQDTPDLFFHNEKHGQQKINIPSKYFIRIGSPLVDRGAITSQSSIGLQYNGEDYTIGNGDAEKENDDSGTYLEQTSGSRTSDQSTSIVSIDINVATTIDEMLVPGIFSSNSIAISRKGSANDTNASFRKLGIVFDLSMDRNEGMHHTVRTLIELGAIEIVGKLTKIPYWECLEIGSAQPQVQSLLFNWYQDLDQTSKREFAQMGLSSLNYYKGPIDGKPSSQLDRAIILYKRDYALLTNARIDYNFYASLLGNTGKYVAKQQKSNIKNDWFGTQGRAVKVIEKITDHRTNPLRIDVEGAIDGQIQLKTGRPLQFAITAKENAYVSCFLQNDQQQFIRLKDSNSQYYKTHETRLIPDSPSDQIKLTQSGKKHTLMCVASYHDILNRIQSLPSHTQNTVIGQRGLLGIYHLFKKVAIDNNLILPLAEFYDVNIIK